MNAVGWRGWIRRLFFPTFGRIRRCRPWLEALEERAVPTVYTVNLNSDTGANTDLTHGDLLYCISQVNSDIYGGTDTIQFNLGSSGVQTINLGSALPALTHPVTIDGTSEPGYAGAPLVVLQGPGPGAETAIVGLELFAGAAGSTVKGLVIDDCNYGIVVSGADNTTIQGNYIGMAADGVTAAGNSQQGIRLEASNCTIGGSGAYAGNVISANQNMGILVIGQFSLNANGNTIEGNLIGTNAAGSTIDHLGNANQGLLIQSAPIPGAFNYQAENNIVLDNTISGNNGSGLVLDAASGTGFTAGTRIQGNLIQNNSASGVVIQGGASGNTVGGSSAADGNYISGNGNDGVVVNTGASEITISDNTIGGNGGAGISLMGSAFDTIEGNYIGVTKSGNKIANGQQGISIVGSFADGYFEFNIIKENVISGNTLDGVLLYGSGSDTIIQGNLIGVDPTGELAMGNGGNGVSIVNGAVRTKVGGTASGEANVIAFNAEGVAVVDSNSIGSWISGNSIFGNSGLGIDLQNGANESLSAPVITSVSSAGEVIGTVTVPAFSTIQIEVFASLLSDGASQGRDFLGYVTLPYNSSAGDVVSTFDLPQSSLDLPGQSSLDGVVVDVTATKESEAFETSDFSPGVLVPAPTVSIDPVVPGAAGSLFQTLGHLTDPNVGVGTAVQPQSGPTWIVNVNYGDGSTAQFVTNSTTFPLSHVYASEGSYLIQVTVKDAFGATSPAAKERAEVFLAGTNPRLVGVGESNSGDTTTVSAPGVTAQVTHYGADPAFLLVTPLPPVVRGFSLVTTGPGGATNTVSYDVRGVNLQGNDVVQVKFTFPAGDAAPQLFYFNGKSFVAIPSVVNQRDHTVTVTFTQNSTPSITDLNGTVFTITAAPVVPTASSNIAFAAGTNAGTPGTGGQGGATGGLPGLGGVLAAAVGALTVGATAAGDGGGGGDDPTNADGPTAVQEILGDLPTGTTPSGDAGTSPGTAVLSPSKATLPGGSPDATPPGDKKKPMPAPPDGPAIMRLWLTAPGAPMVASGAPGVVQRSVAEPAAAPLVVNLAVAAGLPLAAVGLRPRKGRRNVGRIQMD